MNTNQAVRIAKRAQFIHKGAVMVAIEVTNGAIEIYGYDAEIKGLEIFKGYIQDARIEGTLRMRATAALYGGGAETIERTQLSLF